MPKRSDIKKIMLIGSGPIIIGQACEFDYSGVQACKALKEEGYEVVLVNSNPATIMTDPEMADRTYIEPVTPETVAKIIENGSAVLIAGQVHRHTGELAGEKVIPLAIEDLAVPLELNVIGIIAGITMKLVYPQVENQDIITRAAMERVIVPHANQNIVALSTVQEVVAVMSP